MNAEKSVSSGITPPANQLLYRYGFRVADNQPAGPHRRFVDIVNPFNIAQSVNQAGCEYITEVGIFKIRNRLHTRA